jgi:hypothetical protein
MRVLGAGRTLHARRQGTRRVRALQRVNCLRAKAATDMRVKQASEPSGHVVHPFGDPKA